MLSLAGKTALVTGASRGLGRLVACALAEQGCHLVLHARQLDHLTEVADRLSGWPIEVTKIAADFADPQAVPRLLDHLRQEKFQIDLLFNNAAIQGRYQSDFWDIPRADFASVFQVNCIAAIQLCQGLIPGMLQRGFGRVVNVTSGIRDIPELAPYAISKAALDKYTNDIAGRMNDDVLVNSADPDWCRTDLGSDSAPYAAESALPGLLLGAFVNDGRSGRLFAAQEFSGMSLQQAVSMVESG